MKGKLSIPLFAGILVLGTVTVGMNVNDVDASHYRGGKTTWVVGDNLAVEAKGVALCEDSKESICGVSQAKMRLELKVADTSDNIMSGSGKGVLKALSNPIQGFGAVKSTDLTWTIDEISDTIIIQGTASDSTKKNIQSRD